MVVVVVVQVSNTAARLVALEVENVQVGQCLFIVWSLSSGGARGALFRRLDRDVEVVW